MRSVALTTRSASLLFQSDGRHQIDPVHALPHLKALDPRLGLLIDRVGPFRLKLAALQRPLEALAEAIVYQQLTGKAASTIFKRVRALFPGSRFPSATQLLGISEAALRSAGLSRAKTAAIRDLAARTLDGTVPRLGELREMTDDQIVERLVQVRGIGRWTVEMLLIFRLGRPDVLPAHDYGIRKGFALAFGSRQLPSPAQIEKRGARWRPYRTVASWYLWRALELPPGTFRRSPRVLAVEDEAR